MLLVLVRRLFETTFTAIEPALKTMDEFREGPTESFFCLYSFESDHEADAVHYESWDRVVKTE
jgi:hypothetical protein